MLFAQSLMMLACLLPLFLIVRRRPVWSVSLASVAAAYAFLSRETQLMTLYVDLLLPMVAVAGMLLALSSIREPRRAALLALPFSVYAYLVKNSGILFSLLISLLLAGIGVGAQTLGAASPDGPGGWLGVACAFDAVFLGAGLLLFSFIYTGDE